MNLLFTHSTAVASYRVHKKRAARWSPAYAMDSSRVVRRLSAQLEQATHMQSAMDVADVEMNRVDHRVHRPSIEYGYRSELRWERKNFVS